MQEVLSVGPHPVYYDRPANDYSEFREVLRELVREGYEICNHSYILSTTNTGFGFGTVVVRKIKE